MSEPVADVILGNNKSQEPQLLIDSIENIKNVSLPLSQAVTPGRPHGVEADQGAILVEDDALGLEEGGLQARLLRGGRRSSGRVEPRGGLITESEVAAEESLFRGGKSWGKYFSIWYYR